MNAAQVQQYLERIGVSRPARPNAEALRSLQAAHLQAVPFENLSIHLGEPIVLDEAALFDKVVVRHRGGFCYELNGAFAGLLSALGFPVALLAAQVHGERGFGPPFDHLALRVEAGGPHLVDVGFGDHSLHPLRIGDPTPQDDPAGVFTVLTTPEGDYDVRRDGRPQYRAESRERRLSDFERSCWWQQTSPESYFNRSLVCTLPAGGARVTLSGNRLIRTTGGERTETVLGSEAEILDAYRQHFGIALDRLPRNPADEKPSPELKSQASRASTNPNQQEK